MTATPEVDSSSSATTIRNPATGDVAGQVRWTDPADVPRIAAGLREAQRAWEARGAKGRAKVLARYAVWLGEHRDEIEALLIKETGKSAVDAAQEVPLLIMILSYYIKTMEKALAPETRPASLPFLAIKKVTVHFRPRPLVGIIAPWNYPVANALMDAIGALAAGCSVLLKPSERTPLTAEVLLRGWQDSGAPEVLALAQGAREVSEAVIDNSDFIQFTGSCATGAKVMERAARTAHPCQPRTRRQGPDDRARGRRHRARRACRGVGCDVQRGSDVCLGRAGLCPRIGLRPVRRRGRARRREAEDGRGCGLRLRLDDRRQPGRRHRAARERCAGRGRQGADRRAAPGGARAASIRRRCSSTSTIR